MKRALMLMLTLMLLVSACKEEVTQDVTPVALGPDTTGYFCQMTLPEHPGPKGQVHLEGLPGAPLFFSQVRDTIAYQRMPEQTHRILAIYVNDMGAPGATWDSPGETNWIAAEDAFFVLGSDMAGGMGAAEIVPFADRAKAEDFATRHGGAVMRLGDIPDSAVAPPDTATPAGPGAPAETDSQFQDRLRALSGRKPGG